MERSEGAAVRCCCLAILLATFTACSAGNTSNARVVVPRGANLRVAAESLAKAGVVSNAKAFRFYGMLRGRDRTLRAGTYIFRPDLPWSEVLDILEGGKSIEQRITIPEGWSLQQIVPQLARVLNAPVDSVAAAMRDTALLHRLDVPTPTLEGYIFPDTYVFPDGTTPRGAVRLMVSRFEQVWQPEWNQLLETRAMNRNDVMSLAAIVEKEAKLPARRWSNRHPDGSRPPFDFSPRARRRADKQSRRAHTPAGGDRQKSLTLLQE